MNSQRHAVKEHTNIQQSNLGGTASGKLTLRPIILNFLIGITTSRCSGRDVLKSMCLPEGLLFLPTSTRQGCGEPAGINEGHEPWHIVLPPRTLQLRLAILS